MQMRLELNEKQIEELATKLFDIACPNDKFGGFKDQPWYIRVEWLDLAWCSVEGYNTIIKHVLQSDRKLYIE